VEHRRVRPQPADLRQGHQPGAADADEELLSARAWQLAFGLAAGLVASLAQTARAEQDPAAAQPAAPADADDDNESDSGKPSSADAPADAPGAEAPATQPGGADDLTDADFGVVGPDVTVQAPDRREDSSWLSAAGGFALWSRRFDFESVPGMEALRPRGFRSGWNWKASGSLELRPLAWLRRGNPLEEIGLVAEYGRTLARTDADKDSTVRESRLYLGLAYRIAVGTTDTHPTFGISAGYLRHDLSILDDSIELPDVTYTAAALGADVRAPLGTRRLALLAGARYLIVGSGGDLLTPETYGDSRVAGLELGASLELQPFGPVFIRLDGAFTRYSFEFNNTGMLSSPGAARARDQVLAGTVFIGLSLR
jgi:hypothetical protein